MEKTDYADVRRHFEEAFEKYGIPARIRSDNGAPFATRGLSGLSRLSVWWLKLGILPERIQPGHPEQNGRHERMHRTLKQETTRPAKLNRSLQQSAFETFQDIYNNERPHAALGNDTPAQHYQARPRGPVPEPRIEYAPDSEVRKVNKSGTVLYRNDSIYLSKSLSGEPVLLEPIDSDRRFFDVYFSDFLIGRVDVLYCTTKNVTLVQRGNVSDEPGLFGDALKSALG